MAVLPSENTHNAEKSLFSLVVWTDKKCDCKALADRMDKTL